MAFMIYVEGKADKTFLPQYIGYLRQQGVISTLEQEIQIIDCKGREKLWGRNLLMDMDDKQKEGHCILVVFDAEQKAALEARELIQRNIQQAGLEYGYSSISIPDDFIYLFPNNHSEGALDELLENIINQDNEPIFTCWDHYIDCIKNKASKKLGHELTTPNCKAKIYAYLEALLGDSKEQKDKIKEESRDYTNTKHWDLGSPALDPLKKFLRQHLG